MIDKINLNGCLFGFLDIDPDDSSKLNFTANSFFSGDFTTDYAALCNQSETTLDRREIFKDLFRDVENMHSMYDRNIQHDAMVFLEQQVVSFSGQCYTTPFKIVWLNESAAENPTSYKCAEIDGMKNWLKTLMDGFQLGLNADGKLVSTTGNGTYSLVSPKHAYLQQSDMAGYLCECDVGSGYVMLITPGNPSYTFSYSAASKASSVTIPWEIYLEDNREWQAYVQAFVDAAMQTVGKQFVRR